LEVWKTEAKEQTVPGPPTAQERSDPTQKPANVVKQEQEGCCGVHRLQDESGVCHSPLLLDLQGCLHNPTGNESLRSPSSPQTSPTTWRIVAWEASAFTLTVEQRRARG